MRYSVVAGRLVDATDRGALGVTLERAQELTEAGARGQAAGDIGFMKAGRAPNSRDGLSAESKTPPRDRP